VQGIFKGMVDGVDFGHCDECFKDIFISGWQCSLNGHILFLSKLLYLTFLTVWLIHASGG
jgi:hypothetical protein